MSYAPCREDRCNAEGLREVAWHHEVAGGVIRCDVHMVHCDCGRGRAWAARRTQPLQGETDPRPMPMLVNQWVHARLTDDPRGAVYVDPTLRERTSAADLAWIEAANAKPPPKVTGGFGGDAPRQPPAEARRTYHDRDDDPDGWRGSREE